MGSKQTVDDHEPRGSLAGKIGVERTSISRIITGKERPRPEQIGWMERALCIDASELLFEAALSPELQRLIDRLRSAIDRIAGSNASATKRWPKSSSFGCDFNGSRERRFAAAEAKWLERARTLGRRRRRCLRQHERVDARLQMKSS